MLERQLKIVLDTSTIVSALFWEGNEAKLFRKIEDQRANVYITKEILDEVEDVIRRPKFVQVMVSIGLTPEQILEKIISMSQLVSAPKLNIDVCRDKKDNKFLECAENVEADYLVSGDDDLVSLKKYKDTSIVRTSEILKML